MPTPPVEPAVNEITHCLDRIRNGDTSARDELWTAVHNELRHMAGRLMAREGVNTLQPTALVHEVYLRLNNSAAMDHGNRRYFFAAAATSMRRILVERARGLRRQREHAASTVDCAAVIDAEYLVEIDEVLNSFAERFPDEQEIVVLRVFGGRTTDEIAALLELSPSTVKRRWQFAAAWLRSTVIQERGAIDNDAA